MGKPPLGKAQWETDFGFSATRFTYQQEVNAAVGAYMREVNTAGGDLLEVGRALSAFSDPRQRIPLPQDADDSASPDSWQYWYRAGLSDDISRFLSDTYSAEIELTDTATRTHRFEDRWSGGASVSFMGFFGAGGGVSNETLRTHAENDTRRVNIKFENIQAFAVERGQWFKGGIIARFRDRMPAGFWGEGGRLNLIPTSVILVRGLKIEVDTSAAVADYYFNKRTVGGGAGFRIGPWRVRGSGSRTTIEESYDMRRTANGFVLEDTSGRAQVLAVASIRNADLLSVPSSVVPLHRLLTAVEAREASTFMEGARFDALAAREELIG